MRAALIAFIALAACAAQPAAHPGETASVRGCMAAASAPWRPLSGADFTVEARSSGPDCERAVATLTIRDRQGRVLWTDARATEHVMTLRDARNEHAMQQAMAEWIDASNLDLARASELPPWADNADMPRSGEFPFYPEPYHDRASYEALRLSDVPLFCYVQGMESLACVALENGRLEKVGVQSFPG